MKSTINPEFFKYIHSFSNTTGMGENEIKSQIIALVALAEHGDNILIDGCVDFINSDIFDFFCEEYMNYSLTDGYSLKIPSRVFRKDELVSSFYQEMGYHIEEDLSHKLSANLDKLSEALGQFFEQRPEVKMEELAPIVAQYYKERNSKNVPCKALENLLKDAYILNYNF